MISKASLGVIKEALAAITTHTQMASLFEQYGFEPALDADYSNKVRRAATHRDHQNWHDPDVVERLLDLLAHRLSEVSVRCGDLQALPEGCQRVVKVLAERDSFEWTGERFVPRGSLTLLPVAKQVDRFNQQSIRREVERILANVETDPADAITSARALVEATCRSILADHGGTPPDGMDLGPLAKLALKRLQLLPEQIDAQRKGGEAARKVLLSLATALQGLGELRNVFGDAHGRGPGRSVVEARHARLAVGFAGTLATFLLETHEQRQRQGQGAELQR